MVVFRSILVPLKAAVGFLLSIGASLGIVVWIFQDGNLNGLFDVAAAGPITSFLPILLIGILFGLAMDYEVFLVSRMRERFVHTGDAREAVRTGYVQSGRVVIAAATIMMRRLRRLRPDRRPDHQVDRPLAGRRRPRRRVHRPPHAGAGRDDAARQARLVDAQADVASRARTSTSRARSCDAPDLTMIRAACRFRPRPVRRRCRTAPNDSRRMRTMARFMLFMYPGASDEELAEGPSLEAVEAMNRYNEELAKAGALLAARRAAARGLARLGLRRHRRPVQRGQGAGRRLLDHPGQGPRGGASSGPSASRRTRTRSSRSGRSTSCRTSPRTSRKRRSSPPASRRTRRRRDDQAATQRAIEAVWRIESPRLIAALARMMRDVGVAEDLAQDALVAALEKWPQSGVPDNPGAWLMTAAKHRAIDLMRRARGSTRSTRRSGFVMALEHATRRPARTTCSR